MTLYRKANPTSYDSEYDDSDKQIHGQVPAELANYMEQMTSEERMHAFKLVDLGCMYKERVRELGGYTPDRVHTTKLKNRLMAHVEGLREFKSTNYSYMTFDENVRTVLKSFFENNYDDEAVRSCKNSLL